MSFLKWQIFNLLLVLHLFIDNIEDLYAFHYSPQEDKLVQSAGWQVYDVTNEFLRMETPSELWVESRLNKDFKVSQQ